MVVARTKMKALVAARLMMGDITNWNISRTNAG